MVAMPKEKLETIIDNEIVEQELRPYLGYSGLGHPCNRFLWYSFRWAYRNFITRRIKRLFERGDYEESKIIEDLNRHGMVVFDEQKEVVGFEKHVLGHIDGIVTRVEGCHDDELLLLEMKTAKESFYKKYVKNGVQLTNFTYYCQTQSYMGKLGLEKCMFVITNKNDESRYIEFIDFNEDQYDQLEQVAADIVATDVPPNKIGEVTWHECRFCSAKDICHKNKKIEKNCRTCQYGTIIEDGKWKCGKFEDGGVLPEHIQRVGCDLYELLDTLRI